MTKHIHRQIDRLKQRLVAEGTMVEEAVAQAVAALVNRDSALAQEVIRRDSEIDLCEVDMEEDCLKVLALYQPVAADLRFVVAVLKINNDLERMGDHAKNIAKRVRFLTEFPEFSPPGDARLMAEKVQSMIKRSLDALVNHDVALANEVRSDDNDVDRLRKDFHIRVEEAIRKDPDKAPALMSLDNVYKHLERLADMATNIAEDVIYMVEGDIVRHRGDN